VGKRALTRGTVSALSHSSARTIQASVVQFCGASLVCFYNDIDTERLKRLITTHPAKQWTDELTLENGGWEGLNPAFIHCVGQKYSKTSDRMVGPARGPGWEFIELDAPRNAMMTHPDLSAETLLQLAASAA